ncbi:hypothetical protein [Aestuariivivens sediminicola]|uniref:hypothetical protein n=1 Tax=Aestuariivivens sediminicola TaxID=2913560 RepID=UPI001F585594|nr:hypothetical protein [Aestuariivivens sediminicola]
MGNIEEIVDSLENKISKVLHKLEQLRLENASLSDALASSRQELENQKKQVALCEEKYDALKLANSMLGSDDNKRETKLKINALIRDIDHCIAQLSE